MSFESWQASLNEIPQILDGEPSKDRAILLAALYSLKDHITHQAIQAQPKDKPALQDENESIQDDTLANIKDELADAQKYYDLWIKTKEPTYKELSMQELSHAEMLMKIARTQDPNINLQEYLTWHHAILARLV